MSEGQATAPNADESAGRAPEYFPIVGVGASAGGLAATIEVLRHLGAAPGVALVVVHHLDPAHESRLVEICSRATSLPVGVATDGALVERDHVYVVPPNAGILLDGGRLMLTPRSESPGLHLPIDAFLESLAADQAERAIGVLLSGSGSDGAQGIRAIKAAGGITLAQDGSAEYRSMPESAIATGCVDFVLAPQAIALQLVRFGALDWPPFRAADDAADLQQVLSTVRTAKGIDFTNYKQSTVRRRVQRRLIIHALSSFREYAELLRGDAAELDALCEEMLIHVTSFFRDPEMFESLKTTVFPRLLENRPRELPIRVWVPGCSSGEEVYSLAICLLELLADANATEIPIKVFGTDLSSSAIERARAAKYPALIEQDVSQGRLQRFFQKTEGLYQIRKDVRDLCVFAKHDATRDPPFSGVDLVSCRNLMIYFDSALQERVLPIFHYALKEPGFLVLGSSETVRAFPGFSILDPKNKIYARTSAAPRAFFDFKDARFAEVASGSSSGAAKAAGTIDVHREADRLILAEFSPPGVIVTDDLAIIQFRGKTGPFLEPSPGVASFDLLRMVREDLRVPVRQALDAARAKRGGAQRTGVVVGTGTGAQKIEIEVIPFAPASAAQRFFVVLFKAGAQAAPLEQPRSATPAEPAVQEAPRAPENALAQELASTRSYLQSVIEQLEASNEELKAANEEVVSSNEELRSTNEELQMAKEELQATNEELRTINEEMNVRNVETSRLNDDLTNLLSSIEIPIVILGRDLRLRRFTPAAAKLLSLLPSDLGRPISDLRPMAADLDLVPMVTDVITNLSTRRATVQDAEGAWYQVMARPYVTGDNRIDGAVITALDVDEVKKTQLQLDRARVYAEGIVDTVRECLIVLDRDLRVQSANRAFHSTFGTTPAGIVQRPLGELGPGDWALPQLAPRIAALSEGERLEGFRLQTRTKAAERRIFLLNARRIEATAWVLLALEDVTDREAAHDAIARVEIGFREVLTTAAEAIVMTDRAGKIVFANHAAERIFGFAEGELVGRSMDTLVATPVRERHARHREAYVADPDARLMGRGRTLSGLRKDGTQFPIEVVLNALDRAGETLVVSFITDLTARQAADRKIHEYQTRLQEMAFDAALTEERERRRIAADLHDRIGQSLALAQMKLTSMRETLGGGKTPELEQAIDLLAQSASDTRTLMFDLSPPVLYDLGLKEAIAWLIDDLGARHGLHIELRDDELDKPIDDETSALVFRAVRELLVNVVKHAKAHAATVSLARKGDQLEIDVEDSGIGFDPQGRSARGFGLFSVHEQMSRLGGDVTVASAPEKGTRVSMRVPLKPGAKPDANAVSTTTDQSTRKPP